MNYEKVLLILRQPVKLYSSSIVLLRCFSGNILNSLKLIYDFNLKKSDIIVELNNLSNFWIFFIILKNSLLFNYIQLNDITCVDNLNILSKTDVTKTKNRFSLIYIFSNIKFASQLIVKVTINFNQMIPSIFNLFNCASWLEREIFDMFGVIFKNHPDLRRILTDYGFIHHPLQKEFPLTGYLELRYNDVYKCIEYQPVKLMQEYRNFVFESPWNQYLLSTSLNF
jgi:NADH-quinone oxidoreductase subunit C